MGSSPTDGRRRWARPIRENPTPRTWRMRNDNGWNRIFPPKIPVESEASSFLAGDLQWPPATYSGRFSGSALQHGGASGEGAESGESPPGFGESRGTLVSFAPDLGRWGVCRAVDG